ncbi:MAG TPA: response regulator, partial [Thermoanaerobaculia bacterium]|nr:response regulator [Thermoanaerobaculia bacterium]
EFRPDIVLLDIGLPVMDGYELGSRIRELPGLESVHLVAATGSSHEAGEERSRAAGFDAHLVKPISIRTLSRTLDEIMSANAHPERPSSR